MSGAEKFDRDDTILPIPFGKILSLDAKQDGRAPMPAYMGEFRVFRRDLERLGQTDTSKAASALLDYSTNKEVQDLYASPIFQGLDHKSEKFRNIILYMMELSGHKNNGLYMQIVLPAGFRRAGCIAMDGDMDGDNERARTKRERWERFLALMAAYDALYNQVLILFDEIKDQIEAELDKANDALEQHENEDVRITFNKDQLVEHKRQLQALREEKLRKKEELENRASNMDSLYAMRQELEDMQASVPNYDYAHTHGTSSANKNKKGARTRFFSSSTGGHKGGGSAEGEASGTPPTPDIEL